MVNSCNLFQLVSEPTRYSENTASLLDLIITDSPGYVTDVQVHSPIANLDHCIVSCRILFEFSKDKPFTRQIWDYSCARYGALNDALKGYIFDNDDDINTRVEKVTRFILDTTKMYIPCKSVRIRPNDKPYITAACRHADQIRDRWHKRYRRTGDPLHYGIFKEKRAFAKITRSLAKRAYNEKIVKRLNESISPKQYWKIVKSMLGQKAKSGIPTLKDHNKAYVTNTEKACFLNDYFAEQAVIESPPRALPPLRFLTQTRLSNSVVTQSEVEDIISGLDINKANGPDGISNRLLKTLLFLLVLILPIYLICPCIKEYFQVPGKSQILHPCTKKVITN